MVSTFSKPYGCETAGLTLMTLGMYPGEFRISPPMPRGAPELAPVDFLPFPIQHFPTADTMPGSSATQYFKQSQP